MEGPVPRGEAGDVAEGVGGPEERRPARQRRCKLPPRREGARFESETCGRAHSRQASAASPWATASSNSGWILTPAVARVRLRDLLRLQPGALGAWLVDDVAPRPARASSPEKGGWVARPRPLARIGVSLVSPYRPPYVLSCGCPLAALGVGGHGDGSKGARRGPGLGPAWRDLARSNCQRGPAGGRGTQKPRRGGSARAG